MEWLKRNNIISLFLLFIMTSEAIAVEQAPQWSEFCPTLYYQAQPLPDDFIPEKKYPTWAKTLFWSSGVLIYPAIITYPVAITDTKWRRKQRGRKIAKEYNTHLAYWQDREQHFNNAVEACKKSKDKAVCYAQVRQIEVQKTALLKQEEMIKQLEKQADVQALQSAATSLNQVNMNYQLNNINNAIRMNNLRGW